MGTYHSLVFLDLSGIDQPPICMTDSPIDLEYNGYTYRAAGSLLSMDKITSDNVISNKSLSITLSGISFDFQQTVNDQIFRNAPIRIYQAYVEDNTNVVEDTKLYYTGTTQSPSTDIDPDAGTMAMKIECQSIFNLDRTPDLMRCSAATHKFYYPDDDFFNYATQETMGGDVLWREWRDLEDI